MSNDKKNNYKDMMLRSEHGYCMPFPLEGNERIEVMLGFGEQSHPRTGETFFHNGVDFICKDKTLFSLADGLVIGVGQDAVHDNYIVTKYGGYEVVYGHVNEAYKKYGSHLLAGETVGKSGDFLHLGVTFDGRQIDPLPFLGMVYQNTQMFMAQTLDEIPSVDMFDDKEIHTKYDNDAKEILMLMMRWLPNYFSELDKGSYAPSERMQSGLRNAFEQAADKNYLYEAMPSAANPLGLSGRSAPLVEKIETILIGDFLSYMALRHGRFLSTWSDAQKKNLLLSLMPVA